MKEEKLKCGDVVVLKGPVRSATMTVEYVEKDNISCVWFDEEYHLNRSMFKEESLALYKL